MSVLLKPRWLALHAFTVFVVVSCSGLAWWQLVRAQAGNGRSFGYALQWPAMAVFGLGVWAWLCRDGVRTARRGDISEDDVHVFTEPPRTPVQVIDAEDDPELAAYNVMLARMAEQDAQEKGAR